jgi:parvulin-like peptidyl-prolyl isomerase
VNVAQSLRIFLPVFALLLAACAGSTVGQDNPSPNPPTSAPDPNLPVNDAGVQLVAKVNGTEITLPEFEQALTRQQAEIQAADPDAMAASVLDSLIEQTLIEQAASEQQITVTDAEIQAEIQAMMQESGSDSAWQEWLAQNHFTQEQFADYLRESMLTQRIIAQVTQSVTGALPHVHARHILVATEAEANDILSRLRAGEEFAALAASYSRDVTTRETGGDLGWFTQEELLEPSLAQVAFSLEPGQIAGPVPTRLGYHILQTLEKAARPVAPEKQADLVQVVFQNWLQGLRDSAAIERYL